MKLVLPWVRFGNPCYCEHIHPVAKSASFQQCLLGDQAPKTCFSKHKLHMGFRIEASADKDSAVVYVKTSRAGYHLIFFCYSSDLAMAIYLASILILSCLTNKT